MTEKKERIGLVHLYCGDGKGKTTAAMGLIARALGNDYRVLLVQFLKNGTSGELTSLRKLDRVEIMAGQITSKFSISMTEAEKEQTRLLHCDYFRRAVQQVQAGSIDLLVLDEILGAIESDMMVESDLLDFLRHKPQGLEVVITGRHASQAIMETADYISRIECVRHPYARGILARPGIEY